MGAPLWEPLTRRNPSLALRVSDDSSATPTWEEVVAYIITQVYGSYTLGLSQVSVHFYRTYIGLIQVQETKDYHHCLSAPLVHRTVSQYCLGSAPVGNRTHGNKTNRDDRCIEQRQVSEGELYNQRERGRRGSERKNILHRLSVCHIFIM